MILSAGSVLKWCVRGQSDREADTGRVMMMKAVLFVNLVVLLSCLDEALFSPVPTTDEHSLENNNQMAFKQGNSFYGMNNTM